MNVSSPAQSSSGTATILDRLREGQNAASATSTKGNFTLLCRESPNLIIHQYTLKQLSWFLV